MISRICDEFHCLPSQAERELARDPELVFDILQLRGYAQTWQQMEDADDEKGIKAPTGKLADLVGDIEVELWQERRARLMANDGQ